MNRSLNDISVTDDTLKNIILMAPMLDEAGQNRVVGLMYGLLANRTEKLRESPRLKSTKISGQRTVDRTG